jgi:hypothetical protein
LVCPFSNADEKAPHVIKAEFFLGLFFDHEDEGEIFLQNVS